MIDKILWTLLMAMLIMKIGDNWAWSVTWDIKSGVEYITIYTMTIIVIQWLSYLITL